MAVGSCVTPATLAIAVANVPVITAPAVTCDGSGTFYTVTFSITGTGPFTVNGVT